MRSRLRQIRSFEVSHAYWIMRIIKKRIRDLQGLDCARDGRATIVVHGKGHLENLANARIAVVGGLRFQGLPSESLHVGQPTVIALCQSLWRFPIVGPKLGLR